MTAHDSMSIFCVIPPLKEKKMCAKQHCCPTERCAAVILIPSRWVLSDISSQRHRQENKQLFTSVGGAAVKLYLAFHFHQEQSNPNKPTNKVGKQKSWHLYFAPLYRNCAYHMLWRPAFSPTSSLTHKLSHPPDPFLFASLGTVFPFYSHLCIYMY
jgi:hypothetical protein